MTVRRAGISLGLVVVVFGLADCSSIFGPDKDDKKEQARFGIGSSTSFVTTGGASADVTPDDITFLVDAVEQRMSFNAKGGETATGVFNFTGQRLGINEHLHGDIVCYYLNGLNQAIVAGHITSSDPPQDADNAAIWIVEDHGEGSSNPLGIPSTPDRISLYTTVLHLPGNANCTTASALEVTMYPIQTGNVQIHN